MPTLPRSLIPDLSQKWKPPVFYYGWSIGDLSPTLLQYAEEHGLTQYTHTGFPHDPALDDPEIKALWDDRLWSCDEEEEEEEEDRLIVDELTSAQNALLTMVHEAGVQTWYRGVKWRPFLIRGVLHDPGRVISIYSNYELEYAAFTSQEDLEKVQKYFKIQQEPAWYVSHVNATWERMVPRW